MHEHNSTPNNTWFNGQVKSWEDLHSGYRSLFEIITKPGEFCEVMNSAGDDELIELYDFGGSIEHAKIIIKFLDPATDLENGNVVVLDKDNQFTVIPQGSRFIMDTTESLGPLAYTCLIYGEKPLVTYNTTTGFLDPVVTELDS